MKILFCDNTLWGLLNFRGKVIEHCLAKGHEVVCVAPKEENAQMSAANVEVLNHVKYIDLRMERTSRSISSNWHYMSELWRIFKTERPDIIFSYTIKPNAFGGIIASHLHIPLVAMVTGLGTVFENNSLGNRFARLLYKIGLRKAQKVLVLNEGNQQVLINGGFCKADKIIHLTAGEGVDMTDFPAVPNQNAAQPLTFLMIARILKAKGYEEFIKASKIVCEQCPEARFELLGFIDENAPDGIPAAQIEQDMKDYPFSYIGFTHNMKSVYERQNLVIVLPSYHEGMNRTLMEAVASAKPVITTNVSGCKECVEDGVNGYLCEPKSAESLAQALLKYMNLPFEQRKAMAEASRSLAEQRFDIQKVIEVYDQFL